MKNKDLLNILGGIDEDMIEDAAPSFSNGGRVIKRKKRTSMKIVAVAACCALIVCGAVMLLSVLDKIDDPTPRPDGVTGDTEQTGDTEEASSEESVYETNGGSMDDEGNFDPLPADTEEENDETPEKTTEKGHQTGSEVTSTETPIETDASVDDENQEPEEDIYFEQKYTIEDARYSNYILLESVCPIERVGEKICEIAVRCDITYGLQKKEIYLKAEIFKIKDENEDVVLCYRFIQPEEDHDVYIEYNSYGFMVLRNHRYASLARIKTELFDKFSFWRHTAMTYWCDTEEDYCKYFTLSDAVAKAFDDMLFSLDGESIEIVNGQIDIGDPREEISFSVALSNIYGVMSVFDSGYVRFTFGKLDTQIFKIGRDAARKLIDLVLYNSEAQGYVWNEKEGKWYPIKEDELAEYSSFHEALDEGKLLYQLELWKDVEYWETKFHGWSPDVVIINEKTQACVLEVLYECDGGAVEVEDIKKLAGEGFLFEAIYLDGSKYQIAVYDSGHVNLGGHFYYVGTDYTDKIIRVVRVKCTTYLENASYFLWNEKESCWSTYDPEMIETEKETSPNESVDHTSEVDVLETETHIEESVDLPRDDTEIETEPETETCVGIETELESEIAP